MPPTRSWVGWPPACRILQGKHKPTYTPHVDTGDFVIIINAEKVGSPAARRTCSSTTPTPATPAGATSTRTTDAELHPEKVVELAVRRMLPKNKMGRNILGKLKIYKGDAAPAQPAQQPKEARSFAVTVR